MKKLCGKGGKVYPCPSVSSQSTNRYDPLSLLCNLPPMILALTASLSPQDREVLGYLISCSGNMGKRRNRKGNRKEHPASFDCNCFRCYMSYWVRWDSSPNHHLIHEIIDAFEESLLKCRRKEKKKRMKAIENKQSVEPMNEIEAHVKDENEAKIEGSSVRTFMGFIGERLWGSWNP